MLRLIGLAFILQFLALTSAYACQGQQGKVIFEDKFADDTGGWDPTPPVATVKPPAFEFAMNKQYSSLVAQNLTFNATLADYCLDAILPKPLSDGNDAYVGIEFWATDYHNTMLLQLSDKGETRLI
jgi:hypothetical protein